MEDQNLDLARRSDIGASRMTPVVLPALDAILLRIRSGLKGYCRRLIGKLAHGGAFGEPGGDPRRVLLAEGGDKLAHRGAKGRLGQVPRFDAVERRQREGLADVRHRGAAGVRVAQRHQRELGSVGIDDILGSSPGERETLASDRLIRAGGSGRANFRRRETGHVRTLCDHPAAGGGARLFRLSRDAEFPAALQRRADPADSDRARGAAQRRKPSPFPASFAGVSCRASSRTRRPSR